MKQELHQYNVEQSVKAYNALVKMASAMAAEIAPLIDSFQVKQDGTLYKKDYDAVRAIIAKQPTKRHDTFYLRYSNYGKAPYFTLECKTWAAQKNHNGDDRGKYINLIHYFMDFSDNTLKSVLDQKTTTVKKALADIAKVDRLKEKVRKVERELSAANTALYYIGDCK